MEISISGVPVSLSTSDNDSENKNRSLIIVGNGLDLSAKLNSTYMDYFRTRSEQIENIQQLKKDAVTKEQYNLSNFINAKLFVENNNSSTETTLGKNKDITRGNVDVGELLCQLREIDNLSFWEVPDVMKNSLLGDWNGVEDSILDFLERFYSNADGLYDEFTSIKNKMLNINQNISTSNFLVYILYCLKAIDIYVDEQEKLYDYGDKNDSNSDDKYSDSEDEKLNYNELIYQLSTYDFFDIFFEELKKFEHNFSKYLRYESKTIGYKDNVITRIKKLIGDDEFANILSFNYTNYNFEELNKISNISNIHGSLEKDNIIFGVDANRLSSMVKQYKCTGYNFDSVKMFTKTYRIMGNIGDDVEILDDQIDTIKFFGHSLSDADYSYFQSIFDYYNIYKNPIKLIFYFERFNDCEETNQKNNIYGLMDHYGKSLDNKEHGKNILHKLLIEGRIKLKEISFNN